jgi:ABC-type Fe3+ transport system permease subunit
MGWVYDHAAIVLGQMAAFLPVAVVGLWVALRRIDPRLIEAAELAGLSWRTATLRVQWPLLRVWLVGAWAIVFVLALNDAEAAVSLGGPTLSVRIMTLLHYAPDAQVAALCVIQVVVTAAAIGAVAAVSGIWRLASRWTAAWRFGA